MLWLVWGSEITHCFLPGFLSSRAFCSSPSLLLGERCPRSIRKQLWPGLPGLMQCSDKAQLLHSPRGGGRKQHNSQGPEEGSVQEDTPPSFLPLALHLGTPWEQPLPLDASHAGGGGTCLSMGCELHHCSFPCTPDAGRNRGLEVQVSSSPSGHHNQLLFHKKGWGADCTGRTFAEGQEQMAAARTAVALTGVVCDVEQC